MRSISILVLDEATSALDNATEQSVMDAIHNLVGQKTIFLVAHRLFNDDDVAQFRHAYTRASKAIKQLYDAGYPIHSGTDSPAEFIVSGAGLVEELNLLHNM